MDLRVGVDAVAAAGRPVVAVFVDVDLDVDALVRDLVAGIDGAEEPRWSADGSKVYYRSGSRIMSVDVALQPESYNFV